MTASDEKLQGGAYEVLRQRLALKGQELKAKLDALNVARREVFGAREPSLEKTDRIMTDHTCIARDMVAIGARLVFGYDVYIGLKRETRIEDVFCVYDFKDQRFTKADQQLVHCPRFEKDFKDLFAYYKHARFTTFHVSETSLYMVFQTGKEAQDVRIFKWAIAGSNEQLMLHYESDRGDRDLRSPAQHDFEWERTTRDMHVAGRHPHVSIDDVLFVDCVGGDLTIKIEDNTDSGAGIYSEVVEHRDQKLDDADISFARFDQFYLLKIRPYREEAWRYLGVCPKQGKAWRIDDVGHAAIRLPADDGVIFPSGCLLARGELVKFNLPAAGMRFRQAIPSPNGEDFLYVFYEPIAGEYVLLLYNVIEKSVQPPIQCHGFALFQSGALVAFKAGSEPSKSHSIQIWQTPFVKDESQLLAKESSPLARLGNKDLVLGIASLKAIMHMTQREEVYLGLYHDVVREVQDAIGLVHWLSDPATGAPRSVLDEIQAAAKAAIDEHEKVVQLKKLAVTELERVNKELTALVQEIQVTSFDAIDKFVHALDQIRMKRGQFVTLRALRFMDVALVDKMAALAQKSEHDVLGRCVDFLLRKDSLKPFEARLDEVQKAAAKEARVKDLRETGAKLEKITRDVEMLLDLVGSMKSGDAADAAKIIEGISGIVARANQIKAQFNAKLKETRTAEVKLEFSAQFRLLDQSASSFLDQIDNLTRCDEFEAKVVLRIEELESRFAEFDDFLLMLTGKREEIAAAFAAKKQQLEEARGRRIATLAKSAERVLAGILSKSTRFKDEGELNAYFAADPMVEKIRALIQDLNALGATSTSEEFALKLKGMEQASLRQLRDKGDLFQGGEGVVQFGEHRFLVNRQELGVTVVVEHGVAGFRVTGTDYFEPIDDPEFLAGKRFLEQPAVSETNEFSRSDYLVYRFWQASIAGASPLSSAELLALTQAATRDGDARAKLVDAVRAFMSPRYTEGYEKGVHDEDAATLLTALIPKLSKAGPLRHLPSGRALARLFWSERRCDQKITAMAASISGYGALRAISPERPYAHPTYLQGLTVEFEAYAAKHFPQLAWASRDAAQFLYGVLSENGDEAELELPLAKDAAQLVQEMKRFLKSHDVETQLFARIAREGLPLSDRYQMALDWLEALPSTLGGFEILPEAAALIATKPDEGVFLAAKKGGGDAIPKVEVEGLIAPHPLVAAGKRTFKLHDWLYVQDRYLASEEPEFVAFQARKSALLHEKQKALALDAMKPKMLSSFVRNKLFDSVYLRLLGANFAKQIGAYGDKKRTDLMGLLLLISPPGYGKTTLVEYAAERLGLAFIKINGPALGHETTSLDPKDAPNATAELEVRRLNLALALGNNVLICVDDIQHLSAEFLQKFISLCDGQRKIEGVVGGVSRTFDLRGKRVAIVMAGNPYTESGERFRVPDMLANRADTYNLGDVASGHDAAFRMSYLENALTSHAFLQPLSGRDPGDVQALIKMAGGETEGTQLKSRLAAEESRELTELFKRLITVQDVVLKVNQLYIASAGKDERFRDEPPFLLQGSYRSMNKITEKVSPVMNDGELWSLIMDHYRFEAQLLTRGAEFNLLRFKELVDKISPEEASRLQEIRSENRAERLRSDGQAAVRDVAAEIRGVASRFDDWVRAVAIKIAKAS